MSLLQTLQLPPPKKARTAAAPSGGGDDKAVEQAKAELKKAVEEAMALSASIGDAAAKADLAAALKAAGEDRKKAEVAAEQVGRVKAFTDITDKLKERAAEAKHKATEAMRKGVGMAPGKPLEKKEAPQPGVATTKSENKVDPKVIAGAGKMGGAVEATAKKSVDDGKGFKTERSAAFGGKAWVETKQIPYADPPLYEIAFHVSVGGKAGAKAERDGDKGGRSMSASASAELELTITHKFDAAEMQRYLGAVRAGNGSGYQELKVAELAAKGSVDQARALLMKMKGMAGDGANFDDMKDGDEVDLTGTASAEGEVGVAKKGGGASVGIQLGASKSGSVTRKVALKDGSYQITLRSSEASSGTAGAGFGMSGVGMNVAASEQAMSSVELTFVVPQADPQHNQKIQQILAASSAAQVQALKSMKGVQVYESKTTGQGSGRNTGVSAGVAGLNVTEQASTSETVTTGPGGVTKVYTGTNTLGANASLGDKTVAGASQTDQFTGGAGPDNKGFGESSKTAKSVDYSASAAKLVAAAKKNPIGTVAGVASGDTKLLQETTEQQGVALTDDSYGELAALAARGKSAWGKHWSGSVAAYTDWMKTYDKVVAAKGDRQLIAKALAEFEGVAGRGRHDTVRNAVGGSAIAFEFPDALASRKPVYDALIVGDPVGDAAKADPAAASAKLKSARAQLEGLRKEMGANKEAFHELKDFVEMSRRIDARQAEIEQALAKLSAPAKTAPPVAAAGGKGKPNAKEAIAQAEALAKEEAARAADTLRTQAEQSVQRIVERLQNYRAIEKSVFAQMEQEYKGVTIMGHEMPKLSKPDVIKLIHIQNRLKVAFPEWDKDITELRKQLQAAGKDPAGADAYRPDRKHYLEMDRKIPGHEWGKGLPGYEEI